VDLCTCSKMLIAQPVHVLSSCLQDRGDLRLLICGCVNFRQHVLHTVLDSVCDLFRAHLLAPAVVPTRATLGEYVCLHADQQRDCTEDNAGNEQPPAGTWQRVVEGILS